MALHASILSSLASLIAVILAAIAYGAWLSEKDIRDQTRRALAYQVITSLRDELTHRRETGLDAGVVINQLIALSPAEVIPVENLNAQQVTFGGGGLGKLKGQFTINSSDLTRSNLSGQPEDGKIEGAALDFSNISLAGGKLTVAFSSLFGATVKAADATLVIADADLRRSAVATTGAARVKLIRVDIRATDLSRVDKEALIVDEGCHNSDTRWPKEFIPPPSVCVFSLENSPAYRCRKSSNDVIRGCSLAEFAERGFSSGTPPNSASYDCAFWMVVEDYYKKVPGSSQFMVQRPFDGFNIYTVESTRKECIDTRPAAPWLSSFGLASKPFEVRNKTATSGEMVIPPYGRSPILQVQPSSTSPK